MNRVSASIAHACRSTASRFIASWFSASRLTASRLTTSRSIASRSAASKHCSNFVWLWPPSVSPKILNYSFQLHIWVHLISASKCISKLGQLRPPSASPSTLNHGIQVHPQGAMAGVRKYRGDRSDGVTRSIYLADRGVHRHHLSSISSYHTIKIRTLSFPTFGLTKSVWDFMDLHNCVDPSRLVVSYHLTRFICSLSQNRYVPWIPFACLMGVSRCSSDHVRVPSAVRLTVCYISRDLNNAFHIMM